MLSEISEALTGLGQRRVCEVNSLRAAVRPMESPLQPAPSQPDFRSSRLARRIFAPAAEPAGSVPVGTRPRLIIAR